MEPLAVQKIFNCWNSNAKVGKWKTHRKITPDIKSAVTAMIRKGWDADDMCDSIRNFAIVVSSKKTRWTYSKWGLAQFLTRGAREKDWRWMWFHSNNFRFNDWFTKDAMRAEIEDRRYQQGLAERDAKKKTFERPTKGRLEEIKAMNRRGIK